MRDDRKVISVLATVVLAVLAASSASAGTRCKTTPFGGAAINYDQAISVWSANVRRSLGAARSNYGIARGKNLTEQPLAVATLYIVSAYPCRRT